MFFTVNSKSKHLSSGFEQTTLFSVNKPCSHVRWVPCHHGVERPQFADRGKSLSTGVDENILNKQSRTADKRLGVGPTNPQRKNFSFLRSVS
jgi:hypothetical protein